MLTPEQIEKLPETILVDGDAESREVFINGVHLRPDKSLSVANHSPDGFNWGYGGSGPAQLALAILLRFLPKEEACNLYQSFKFKIVAGFPQGKDFEERISFRQIIKDLQEKKE